jgi:uncharacterized protein YcbK (DUF882 family)
MSISATSLNSSTAIDQTSARETRFDQDRAEEFAGMFSNAVHSAQPKPEPRKPREGTSELDRPEQEHEEDDEGKKAKRAKARPTSSTTATNVTASSDEIVQSTAALDPELQAKLARVMARMRDETGHDVKVAETYRSQGRQDALFAQGRETPGPVVTWTRNSKHTQGRAVDLVLDGGKAGFDAYATLQRIAQEEGLRTLGARDPGHLELPGTAAVKTFATHAGATADVTPMNSVEPADATGPGQVSIARLAQVAQVAQVSVAEKPAQVARVATVARVEMPGNAVKNEAPTAPSTTHPVTVASEDAKGTSQRFGGGESGEKSKGEHKGGGYSALAAAVAMRQAATQQASVGDVGATSYVSAAERAAQVIAAYEDAPARPLSQITMNVDAGNGTTDRIQIAMRGSTLNARIDAADSHGAQAMNSRADELVKALSRDGIEVESLRVRAASTTMVNAVSSTHTPADASNHSRSDRSNAWQQHERQRSQDERRQQQRDQRGGQK